MRVAIVGFGSIALKHKQVIEHAGDIVVASVNRSEEGRSNANKNGIVNTYSDIHKMIEKERPEAIVVTVSYDKIYEVTRSLIPFAIPLLVEKPAGTSVGELTDLTILAEKYKTVVQVAMNRRHYGIINSAITDMGGKSNITAIDIEWSEPPLRLLNEKGFKRDQIPKVIYGNSIHGIDMACYYSGGIQSISFQTKDAGNDFRWYMQFMAKSENGALVTFRSSWDQHVPWRLVISSKSKRYVFSPLERCFLQQNDASDIIEIKCEEQLLPLKAGFLMQWEYFKRLVVNPDLPNEHDLKSCAQSTFIAEEFYKSFIIQ